MRQKNNQTIADSIVFLCPLKKESLNGTIQQDCIIINISNPILREESQNHDCFIVLCGRGRNLRGVEAWPNLPAHR